MSYRSSSPPATLLLAWFAQNERKHAEALLTSAKPIVAGAQYQMDDAGRREAFKFFQVASGFGDASSTGYVGVSFRNGWGAPQDYAQALHFLRDAANEGDANAMDNLGSIYDSGEAEKQGFAQDFAQAREWYERAAACGQHRLDGQSRAALRQRPGRRRKTTPRRASGT